MNKNEKRSVIVFGGSGFIGQHFAVHLIEHAGFSLVILADIVEPAIGKTTELFDHLYASQKIQYCYCDVRNKITLHFSEKPAIIANFAAVHREPGHISSEYYDTNLPGAENICNWANKIGCSNMIFTSSIATYGPTELPMTEASVPHPITAYGGSKLAAEYIHRVWHAKDAARKLVIVRPGVVYGPGEGGNVTRLISAYLSGYFFYMGNKNTRKAGVYVKELCHAMLWVFDQKCDDVALFNMSMNPGPTIEEYLLCIREASGRERYVPSIPFPLLHLASRIIASVCRSVGIEQPINPIRLKKLTKSNNIVPQFLEMKKYEYQYSFVESMKDWMSSKDSEWR
jgi:GlcNAc-P-P-Und epimerase